MPLDERYFSLLFHALEATSQAQGPAIFICLSACLPRIVLRLVRRYCHRKNAFNCLPTPTNPPHPAAAMLRPALTLMRAVNHGCAFFGCVFDSLPLWLCSLFWQVLLCFFDVSDNIHLPIEWFIVTVSHCPRWTVWIGRFWAPGCLHAGSVHVCL